MRDFELLEERLEMEVMAEAIPIDSTCTSECSPS